MFILLILFYFPLQDGAGRESARISVGTIDGPLCHVRRLLFSLLMPSLLVGNRL